MNPRIDRGPIRPKISTMPRKQSEASMQLEVYRLVTEKQRLENELRFIEQRRHQVRKRLGTLNNEISQAEKKIQNLQSDTPEIPKLISHADAIPPAKKFETFELEY
ncbi:MAG: hypothetical protein ACM37W_10005 [Actinomycetota bacterium]